MQISLQKVNWQQVEKLDLEEQIELDELTEEIKQLVSIGPIQARVEVSPLSSHLYELSVHVGTEATFLCSRCLTKVTQPISGDWVQKITDDPAQEMDTDEEEIIYVNPEGFEVMPFMREALLLAFPYAPLCDDVCQGLCPKCGANRNVEKCQCKIERIDPRLAVLEQWFAQNQENE
jgi:uncharacterized protein